MQSETDTEPPETVIEALRRCARAAEALNSSAGYSVAGRLYVKAWELEHRSDDEDEAEDTSLLEWAEAEQARIDAARQQDDPE